MDAKATRIQELEREVTKRDQVIGELTIANRILKKNHGRLVLSDELREEIM